MKSYNKYHIQYIQNVLEILNRTMSCSNLTKLQKKTRTNKQTNRFGYHIQPLVTKIILTSQMCFFLEIESFTTRNFQSKDTGDTHKTISPFSGASNYFFNGIPTTKTSFNSCWRTTKPNDRFFLWKRRIC